jgi:bla regulator protein blaR1
VDALLQIGVSNALMATVLAVPAVIVTKLARRPALSHALWLLVLLKLITPPLVVVPVDWPTAASAVTRSTMPADPKLPEGLASVPAAGTGQPHFSGEVSPTSTPQVALRPVEHMPAAPGDSGPQPAEQAIAVPAPAVVESTEIPWLALLGSVWLAGSAAWFMMALRRIGHFQRLLSSARPGDSELQQDACRIAQRLGLRHCPGVWLVPGTLSPLLWAINGYPRLVLPGALLDRLDASQRGTLLAHELAHYRRRDHWVRYVEFAALGLYWWFPILWWARRELREAEEECCDAWVVWALPGAVKAYATTLVETLDFLSRSGPGLPVAASGLGHLHLVRRRLTMIMRGTRPRQLTGLGFLAVLGLAALLLPLLPTLAQVPGDGNATSGGQPGTKEITKDDLKRAADDLARVKAEIDRLREEYDRKAAALNQATKQPADDKSGKRGGGSGVIGGGGLGPDSLQSMEKRLSDVEKKLDTVLQELQELRRQLPMKGGPPPKGGPGGRGGFKGGPGFGPPG